MVIVTVAIATVVYSSSNSRIAIITVLENLTGLDSPEFQHPALCSCCSFVVVLCSVSSYSGC